MCPLGVESTGWLADQTSCLQWHPHFAHTCRPKAKEREESKYLVLSCDVKLWLTWVLFQLLKWDILEMVSRLNSVGRGLAISFLLTRCLYTKPQDLWRLLSILSLAS